MTVALPQEKLRRLATKFLDPTELAESANHLDRLALRWSAKEALYKLHGRKRLSFADQLKTKSFTLQDEGTFASQIIEEEGTMHCTVFFKKASPAHWLTVALEDL